MTKNIHDRQNFGNLTEFKDRDSHKYSKIEASQFSHEELERARMQGESNQSRE
jgi:hypothetical protein